MLRLYIFILVQFYDSHTHSHTHRHSASLKRCTILYAEVHTTIHFIFDLHSFGPFQLASPMSVCLQAYYCGNEFNIVVYSLWFCINDLIWPSENTSTDIDNATHTHTLTRKLHSLSLVVRYFPASVFYPPISSSLQSLKNIIRSDELNSLSLSLWQILTASMKVIKNTWYLATVCSKYSRKSFILLHSNEMCFYLDFPRNYHNENLRWLMIYTVFGGG